MSEASKAMSQETWAIVAATGLGPIFAVLITIWRDWRNSIKSRRLNVFRTLMATRRVGISPEHVNALNLVEVDFYGIGTVQRCWRAYKDHLFADVEENAAWHEKKERLLADMLFQMARTLRFQIPALEIFKGGYAPKGWEHRNNRQNVALEYLNDLYHGTRVVPIGVVYPPATSPNPPVTRHG